MPRRKYKSVFNLKQTIFSQISVQQRKDRKSCQKYGQVSIILLHENEKRIYGDTPKRCLDILESVDSPYLRAIFDPANFVQIKVDPLKEAFPLLFPYIEYVHIKDALSATGKVVPPGEGDGNIKEILRFLKERGFRGFLSLEPHLELAEEKGGFSGKAGFRKAAGALKRILKKINVR